MVDQSSGSICVTVVQKKGDAESYGVARLSQWIERCGYTRIMLTTDQNHAAPLYLCGQHYVHHAARFAFISGQR